MKKRKRTSVPSKDRLPGLVVQGVHGPRSTQGYTHLGIPDAKRKPPLWLAGGSIAGAASIGATLAGIKGAIIGGLVGLLVALGWSTSPKGSEFDPAGEGHKSGGLFIATLLSAIIALIISGFYFLRTDSTIPKIGTTISLVTDTRRVDVYELNMRESPSLNSPIKFILPQGTVVQTLNDAQQEFNGDVWIKVRVQTREGLQDGWVNSRYIR
jgi:hypothetical protein